MAVKDLPPGADPANPPLTPESREAAEKLVDELVLKYGEPSAIFHSPMLRCVQTAQPAIDRFGRHWEGGVPVVSLNTLCQPDSGDVDPTNPKARADGLVIYGHETFSPDWFRWFLESIKVIEAVETYALNRNGPIYVFTHRPLVAAARWAVNVDEDAIPERDAIDALDKSLLPYCVFTDNGWGGWEELQRK